MKPVLAWQAAQGQLQMDMAKASYDTWVKDAEFISYEDGVFIIGVQNAYARDWLDGRLKSTLATILKGSMNRSIDVRFIVWQDPLPVKKEQQPRIEVRSESYHAAQSNTQRNLNIKYSFENFIVGSSNRLAHAAALAVAENPAQAYNPLFLYGGVGLGKTHLLQAIGNKCVQKGLQVLYVSSEEFTNDLINAIRTHNTQSFRDKYRQIGVLLIDDIQFIAGKESTQEEFFHTFNTLHGQDKQIVLSSDRPPKAMVTLEERLRSRFEWGLTADIQAPDYETRIAILRSKALRAGYNISPEIIEIIAQRFQSNIRELEGALTRIVAYADLRGMEMTLDLIDGALADLLPQRKTVKPDHIIEAAAESYGISIDNILSRERSRKVALPRQIAMYLLREEANLSLPQIGNALGGRDHTTVIYGCEKVADLIERDEKVRRQVLDIREKIYGQPGFAD